MRRSTPHTPSVSPALVGRRLLRRGPAGREAFTLVEILVVVAIMVILASVGTVATLNQLSRARDKQTLLRMAAASQACKAYATDHDSQWPQSLNELVQPSDGGKPYLEGGQPAIANSKGQLFTLRIVNDNFGTERPVIVSTGDSNQELVYPDK